MIRTLPETLADTVAKRGDKPALTRLGSTTETWTWSEFDRDVRNVAKALIGLQQPAGAAVVILGGGAPEWMLADVGAILAGGLPAGIYTTSSKEQCAYIAKHCTAHVAFTENAQQSQKFLDAKADLPDLQHIVQWGGTPPDGVLTWDAFLAHAASVPDADLEARMKAQKIDDPATLIYTSGTTGEPKGVIITHRNMTWTAAATLEMVDFGPDERCVSYLPLSHIAEQILSIYAPITLGSQVAFAESMEKLPEALQKFRPTYFMGVPRVWEKIETKLRAGLESATGIKKSLAKWAQVQGIKGAKRRERGEDPGLQYKLADKLVFSKIRDRLGLDQCRLAVTAAAPIGKSTLDFFFSLGIPIMEVYGMSECTGPASVSLPGAFRIGKCGQKLRGTEIKIAADGEVCMKGNHVFAGYFRNDAATKEAIDDDGWLHTGDIGTLDASGFLAITDRKKELLITAGGENVAPAPIESLLRSIDGVAHAMVVGDRQKYLGALLTIDGERLAHLSERTGTDLPNVSEAAKSDSVREYFDGEITRVNKDLARVQTIKKFVVLPREFTTDGGELTGTLKLKRKIVNALYADEIASLYEGG